MKNRITEIKNKTIYIEDCLAELKKVIEELEQEELTKAINTSDELQVNETFIADGTASEMDDCEATDGCKRLLPILWGGMIILLVLTLFLTLSE